MDTLLQDIKSCKICEKHLPLGPRPLITAHPKARIAIIGQAPGSIVHASGIPWSDQSGKQLRKWLHIIEEEFYNPECFAIIPMGFCYPGKGTSGDLPPRPECAPMWHKKLFEAMPDIQLIILVGQYAQDYYLKNKRKNLTETVRNYKAYLPDYFPLPHPSPRNRFWLTKNPWFEQDVIPELRKTIRSALS